MAGNLCDLLDSIKSKPDYKEKIVKPIESFLKQSFNKDIGSSCIFIRPNGDSCSHVVSHTCCYYLKKKSHRKYAFIDLDCAMHRTQNTLIRQLAKSVYEDEEYAQFQKKPYNEQLISLSDYFKAVVKRVILVVLNVDRLIHDINQTLIYTLLDATRYNSNFIFIGDTTRLNVVEMMEKRVKSRFSHQVYTLTSSIDADQFVTYLKELVASTLGNHYDKTIERFSNNILLQDTSFQQLNNLSILAHVHARADRQNPADNPKKFYHNCVQSNDVKILSGLSNFELVVVLIATKIAIQKSTPCCFTPLQLHSDFNEFILRTNYRVIDADMFIFNNTIEDLCCYGIFIKPISKHMRYQLALDPYEIVDYVKKESYLPQDIKSIVYNS